MSNLTPKVLVPAQDSAANTYMHEVLGNKTDSHNATSLYGKVKTLGEHIHSVQKVYPSATNGVEVTASVTPYTFGNYSEIVPANTINADFDIHYITIEALSANDLYEIALYVGAVSSEVELGRARFVKSTNLEGTTNQEFQSLLIPKNSRISARIMSASGNDFATISIVYHTY